MKELCFRNRTVETDLNRRGSVWIIHSIETVTLFYFPPSRERDFD